MGEKRFWRRHGCGGRLHSVDGAQRPWQGGMRLRAGVSLQECARCDVRWIPRWESGPDGDGRVCERDPRWDTIGDKEARAWALRFVRERGPLGLGGASGIFGGPDFQWDATWIVVAPRWPEGRDRIGSILELGRRRFLLADLAAAIVSPQLSLFEESRHAA